jgi:hypothetical protein
LTKEIKNLNPKTPKSRRDGIRIKIPCVSKESGIFVLNELNFNKLLPKRKNVGIKRKDRMRREVSVFGLGRSSKFLSLLRIKSPKTIIEISTILPKLP